MVRPPGSSIILSASGAPAPIKVADVLRNPKRYIEIGIEVAETYRNVEDPDLAARFLLETASMIRLERSRGFPNLQNYFGWPPQKIA